MSIFKYVTEERIDVLQNCLIRFTQPPEFNDPFETYPFLTSITDHTFAEKVVAHIGDMPVADMALDKEGEDVFQQLEKDLEKELEKHHSQLPLLDTLWKELLNNPKPHTSMEQAFPLVTRLMKLLLYFVFTSDYKPARQELLPIILGAFHKAFGILSLTEKSDNLLMWAHYANSHQGFVIEFDEAHDYFSQRIEHDELTGHLEKVVYSSQRPQTALLASRTSV